MKRTIVYIDGFNLYYGLLRRLPRPAGKRAALSSTVPAASRCVALARTVPAASRTAERSETAEGRETLRVQ